MEVQFEIREATIQDRRNIRSLLLEYLSWVSAEMKRLYGVDNDPNREVEHDLEAIWQYLRPRGRLLLAVTGTRHVGMVGLRTVTELVCEIKRLYVTPLVRGNGIGKALLREAIAAAGEMGCNSLILDTVPRIYDSTKLYQSLGFNRYKPDPTKTDRGVEEGDKVYMKKEIGVTADGEADVR